jgi:hypothetical protein
MKKNKFLILFLLLGLGINQSCTDGFEEANTDPTSLTDVELNLQLPEILASSAFNAGANQNRIAGLVMQQFFGLDAQQEAYMRYVLPENTVDNYWQLGLYSGVLRSCTVISDKAAETNAPFYGAVADIVLANQLGIATSFFGDMPFSEAFQGVDVLQPRYDSQESIYASVQSLLDGAISTLSGLTDSGGYFGGDLIYDGDSDLWIKTARGLKARFLLHTVKRDPSAAQAAMTNASQSYASNAENCSFAFGLAATDNYSLAQFGLQRPGTLGFNSGFADMLADDPRLPFYTDANLDFFDAANANLVWAKNDAVIPLMSHVEVAFIMAELTALGGGDATAQLETAIRSSMELVGVTDQDAITAYVTSATANVTASTVVEEAYKGYYGFNFHETWSNWRRTGSPALTVRPDGSSDFMSSLVIPQRLFYGDSESTTNSANVEAAQAAQGGGLLDVPVWAFQ